MSVNIIGQAIALENRRPPLEAIEWPDLRDIIQVQQARRTVPRHHAQSCLALRYGGGGERERDSQRCACLRESHRQCCIRGMTFVHYSVLIVDCMAYASYLRDRLQRGHSQLLACA